MSSSVGEVGHGVELVHETGAALERTIAQVAEISRIVGEIAEGAKRQASGVAEINARSTTMDKTTQENAAMVDQSTAATHSLSAESRKLRNLVAQFTLGLARADRSGGARAA